MQPTTLFEFPAQFRRMAPMPLRLQLPGFEPVTSCFQSKQFAAKVAVKGRTGRSKETTLERADFTLQLLMFVTIEKETEMFIIFFLSSFSQRLSPRF